MSDYSNPNSSQRGGRRRRSGGRPPRNDNNSGYTTFKPNKPKEPTGFEKFLSVITFGLLGKSKPKPYNKPVSAQPSNSGRPRTEGPINRSDRENRNRESRPPRQQSSAEVTGDRLYVGNLSYDATESDLFELFKGAGNVKNAEVVVNSRTQRSKGFAFVTMMSVDEAKKAVAELHSRDFMGRPLVVGGAKPLDPDSRNDRGPRDDQHGDSSPSRSNPDDVITRPEEDEVSA